MCPCLNLRLCSCNNYKRIFTCINMLEGSAIGLSTLALVTSDFCFKFQIEGALATTIGVT
jgi:hypothetical protein